MQIKKLLLMLIISLSLFSCGNNAKQVNNINAASVKSQYNKTALSEFTLPRTANNFPDYIKTLKRFASENGINHKTINDAFTNIYYLGQAITADRNQPEKKWDINQYLAIVASPSRLMLAKQKMAEYRQQVNTAQYLTGVPAEYIIALWGIESRYGAQQGKEDVISALSTLAFEGRRETFFSKELLAALKILERGDITKDKFKGSWAGAMGQCQFMPSSLLHYGKDGDGDGKVDIWNNVSDVLASIGNYLSTIGWDKNNFWGNKVVLPVGFDNAMAGVKKEQAKSLAAWQKLGLQFADNKEKPADTELAWVIIPTENKKEGYVVYNNFKTLMNWNRSYFFAISVGIIADNLMEQR